MTLADGSMFYGSNTLLVFLPFVLAGAGLFFIVRAASDKVDRRTDEGTVRQLPTKELYPLYHVHMQIRSATAESPAKDGDGNERPPSSRPRGTPSGRGGLKIADGS
jgi:hypothetical protein